MIAVMHQDLSLKVGDNKSESRIKFNNNKTINGFKWPHYSLKIYMYMNNKLPLIVNVYLVLCT